MLADRNATSTTLFTAPPCTTGTSAAPSLANLTLSLVPGTPMGDQFPSEDQSVSPAVPLHVGAAPQAGAVAVTTPASSVTIKPRCGRTFLWEAPRIALWSRIGIGPAGCAGIGFIMVPSIDDDCTV